MSVRRLFSLVVCLPPVLLLVACAVPSPAQRRLLDSMIGRSPVDVVRQFGVPTRTYSAQGHSFLAYIDNQTTYSPGAPGPAWGWGWGWGGYGWGGGWGWDGLPPTYYTSTCQTTFEVVGDKVTSWTMRGDGC